MTRLLTFRDSALVADMLGAGEVVGLPTDTVYGVAASISRPDGVARLFSLKGRPVSVALPVMVGDIEQVTSLGVDWNDHADELARAFWPGPLTIVVGAPPELSSLVGSTSTVGFRQPGDLSLLGLLRVAGPLAVTSANAHGQPPCHDVNEVMAAFAGSDELAAVIDGGTRDGRVSTVVDVSEPSWRVLRDGAIHAEAIDAVLTLLG